MVTIPAVIKRFVKQNLKDGAEPSALVDEILQMGVTYEAAKTLLGKKFPTSYPCERKGDYYKALNSSGIFNHHPPHLITDLSNKHVTLFQLEEVLDSETCQALIDTGRTSFGLSTTMDNQNVNVRTSTTCFLKNINDPVYQGVDHTIIKKLGLFKSVNHEKIQLQRYTEGQEYKAHHDYYNLSSPSYASSCVADGQRSWTFMIYLTDVTEGGETEFPMLNIKVKPKQGRALVWNSLDAIGMPNKKTLHVAHPVIKGEKVIITKWFRDR